MIICLQFANSQLTNFTLICSKHSLTVMDIDDNEDQKSKLIAKLKIVGSPKGPTNNL